MKNKILFFFLSLVLITLVTISCTKQNAVGTVQTQLYENMSFRSFVGRDLARKLQLATDLNPRLKTSSRLYFRNDLSAITDPTEENVQAVYLKYSLTLNVTKKLLLTNIAEQVKLLEKIPSLQLLSEAELETTLKNNYRLVATELFEKAKLSVTKKYGSNDDEKSVRVYTVRTFTSDDEGRTRVEDDFETLYNSIPTDMTEGEIVAIVDAGLYDFLSTGSNDGLTMSEVLGCAQTAFLSLIGSVTGIVQIGKLIEVEGISAGIKAISKFIVRNAGWVTAAVLAANVGICLYQQAHN